MFFLSFFLPFLLRLHELHIQHFALAAHNSYLLPSSPSGQVSKVEIVALGETIHDRSLE